MAAQQDGTEQEDAKRSYLVMVRQRQKSFSYSMVWI